jgi:transposase
VVARRFGVHRAWVYKLKARYQAKDEAALEPRSRRPKTFPTAIPAHTVELIGLRKELGGAGWTPGRTPSAGTCDTGTASPCQSPRSAGH